MTTEKDKVLAQSVVREWAEHDMDEHYNSDYLRDEFGSEHLEQRIEAALAAARKEARAEAFKDAAKLVRALYHKLEVSGSRWNAAITHAEVAIEREAAVKGEG